MAKENTNQCKCGSNFTYTTKLFIVCRKCGNKKKRIIVKNPKD